jgi:predicted RNA binding protein YcfA (HicA-like mRNA interferase family)
MGSRRAASNYPDPLCSGRSDCRMKLPKGQDGVELVKMLKVFGYIMIRPEGSHMRLRTTENGKHHLSVVTGALKVGTLDRIIGLVA